MSKAIELIKQLPLTAQETINIVYGSIEAFYTMVYLIARNEHILQEEKPQQWEQRMEVIHAYQTRIEQQINRLNVDGKEFMAEVASDYLEDYVNYREQDFGMSNEEFITLIKRIN